MDEAKEDLVTLRGRLAGLAEAHAVGQITLGQLVAAGTKLTQLTKEAEKVLARSGAARSIQGLTGPDTRANWEKASLARQRSVVKQLLTIRLYQRQAGGEQIRITDKVQEVQQAA